LRFIVADDRISLKKDIEENATLSEESDGYKRFISIILNVFLTLEVNDYIIIDEPEIHLHPTAIIELLNDIKDFSKEHKVIIVTHSNEIVKNLYCDKTTCINIIHELNAATSNLPININSSERKLILGYPTYGEIAYKAFNYCSSEFHNDLYNLIEFYYKSRNGINEIFSEYDSCNTHRRIRTCGKIDENITIHQYIRDEIHHPNFKSPNKYTEEQLRNSIIKMIEVIDGEKITSKEESDV
jgi:hypothetical protein